MDSHSVSDRIAALAAHLRAQGVEGYIQPSNDEFQSEYTPASARRLEWLSGFSGSMGTLAVAINDDSHKAALFVDGRYTLQAAQQTAGAGIAIHNISEMTAEKWLAQQAEGVGWTIGLDLTLHTVRQIAAWEKKWQASPLPVKSTGLAENPVDAIWKDRPASPASPIVPHPLEFASRPVADKLAIVTTSMAEHHADGWLLAAPDGIGWLLNMRGSDVDFNPLVLCYAIVSRDGAVQLITQPRDGAKSLEVAVSLVAPEQVDAALEAWRGKTLLLDPHSASQAWQERLEKAGIAVKHADDPTALAKACKTPEELNMIRQCHRRDGAAVARFLNVIEAKLKAGDSVDELEIAELLEAERVKDNLYQGASFDTIAGTGANGAVIHYRADEKTNRVWQKGELLVLDSGGQYLDGTTDITRTLVNGEPSAEMKRCYTLVLKGHIALATAMFPEGTSGAQLDALARQYLWAEGLDYDHGTGHGVGFYLCVHEGPQRISKKSSDVPLKPGMILSNEPGYYRDGAFGIRIENLVAVVEKGKTEKGKLLFGFETLTVAPLEAKLVEEGMLTEAEKAWLAEYQESCAKNF